MYVYVNIQIIVTMIFYYYFGFSLKSLSRPLVLDAEVVVLLSDVVVPDTGVCIK